MSRGFFDRLLGRGSDEERSAYVAPTVPTSDDLLAALARVEAMVAAGAVPAPVASRVRRVDRVVRDTIPRLATLGAGSPQAYSVMATATDYLPEAVGGYLRLPRDFADNRPVDRGKSSLMVLIDQLDLLASTMDKVFDAVCRADAAALVAHGRFLAGEVRDRLDGREPGRGNRSPPADACHARRDRRQRPPAAAAAEAGRPDGGPGRRRPHARRGARRARGAGDGCRCRRRVRARRGRRPSPPRWPSPRPGPPATGPKRRAGAAPRTSSTPPAADVGGATPPRRSSSSLAAQGSPHASAYAASLAEVASAACLLGEPTMRVIGNASVAAAAQLAAVAPRAVPAPPTEMPVPAAPDPPGPERPSPHPDRPPRNEPPCTGRARAGALDELLAELDATDRAGAGQAGDPPPGRAAAGGEAARRGRA